MQFRSIILPLSAAAMLAACSSADEPVESEETVEAPAPQLTSTPVPTQAADGSPLAAGEWSINESGTGASAAFGLPGENAQILLTCQREGNVMSMSLAGEAEAMQSYVLESGGTAARLDMLPGSDDALPMLSAEIARDAPIFGGFVQAGGTIEISSPQGAVLRVPASPGIRRVFEACA